MDNLDKWYIQTLTYPELLNRNARDFRNRTAQIWRDETGEHKITYGELGRKIRDISCGLMKLGFNKGDRAAIIGNTSPLWALADYGIICAGGISVCLYSGLSEDELIHILNDSGCRIIFTDDLSNLERIRKIGKSLTFLEKIVFMHEKKDLQGSEIIDVTELASAGRKFSMENLGAYEIRWKSVQLEDKMMIVYTSGTTGLPKGVVHTHFSFNSACKRDLSMIPVLKGEDVFLSFLSLAYTYEKQCGHGVALYSGSVIAYSSSNDLIEDLSFFSPTIFMSVPRVFERIYLEIRKKFSASFLKRFIIKKSFETAAEVVEAIKDDSGFIDMSEENNLSDMLSGFIKIKYRIFDKIIFHKVRSLLGGKLRFAFSASGRLSGELCEAFLCMGIRIFEGYGSTETLNTINLNRFDKILPGSVGPLSKGVTGKLGQDGEWLVKGNSLFLEYWNKPDLTKEAFTEDGFYKTGDIVEELKDGYLKIKGRKKGVIKLRTGKKISSSKIESLFATRKYVDLVVAYGTDRKFVTALVIPDFDAIITKIESKGESVNKKGFVYENGICMEVKDNFLNKKSIRKIIDSDLKKVNKSLEDCEKIKKYIILNRRLSEKSGELTPTLKVKKNIVLKKHKEDLDRLYLE